MLKANHHNSKFAPVSPRGRTTEQNENTKREQTFLAEKNKQASILAAEKES